MKGSLDDNYSISSIPVDRWKFERFQEEIYRSEAVQQSLSFPFSSLSTSTPSSGHFFSPLPRWKPVGCNARYTRSRKEISSWEISNRGTIGGEGKGFFSRKLSGNSCCCTFCSCCARKMQREKERGWDEGWAGNEFRMAFSRDYAFRFYNGERRVPRHVSILIGFDDRPAFRKSYWWKIEASAVRFLSWKRIDTFEFNLLRRKPLQYCVHAAYENYSSTVSPLIK